MKFLLIQFAYFFGQRETRRNLVALGKFFTLCAVVVVLFALTFHVLMAREGQEHSWLTGFYWAFTVMTTLGFGDITFRSDLGRAFSIVVMLTGNLLLLVVMPFTIIRWFYAPWLEAQLHVRAPRSLPETTRGHVILCGWGAVARELALKLQGYGIPYFLVEADPTVAARLHGEGVRVVAGDLDAKLTYDELRVTQARAVITTVDDPSNTNITLTVREASPSVPILSLCEDAESAEVLRLAGATQVLTLKQNLGEQLVSRADTASFERHVVGTFKGLRIVELPVKGTSLVGATLRSSQLRTETGVTVIGAWERGAVERVAPDLVFEENTVLVVVGTEEQMSALRQRVVGDAARAQPSGPILIVGGGLVGRAAAEALRRRGVRVHLVERDPEVAARCEGIADAVLVGNAADRHVLQRAGLGTAPSVVLTTNSDEMNVYLCIYCRRLRDDLRIVSRITHERNLESINRAGADFVLSYATLGKESLFSMLTGRGFIVLGEGVELLSVELPAALVGLTLQESALGARTGLDVIAIERQGQVITGPRPSERLLAEDHVIAIGTDAQREALLHLTAPEPLAAR